MVKKKEGFLIFLCFTVAIAWGLGYIFVPIALKCGFSASQINAIRFAFAAVAYYIIFHKDIKLSKSAIIYGGFCGLIFFTSFMFLTVGQSITTPSKTAFLVTMCSILIPFVNWLIFKNKPDIFVYLSAIIYFIGVYILFLTQDTSQKFGRGDLLVLISAVFFALDFVLIAQGLNKYNTHTLNFIQFAVVGLLSVLYALFLNERIIIEKSMLFEAILSFIALVLVNTVYAYYVQTYSQNYIDVYKVCLITSTENIWAVVFSALFGLETLTSNTIIGGIIIMLSIFVSDALPSIIKQKKDSM